MIFADYTSCGNCGPTAGSGRCIPCERESQLEYFGAAEAAAATSAFSNRSAVQSIALGVGTGLTVWAITRFLDRHILRAR